MWQTQDVLHKKPQLVPGTILAVAGSLLVYRHVTHVAEQREGDLIRSFLTMSFLQMLPLAILEMKIMRCADPVGLFCKFATPVTLIHIVFLGMRLVLQEHETATLWYSAFAFVGGIVVMCKVYRQTLLSIINCKAVWSLIMLCVTAAFITTAVDFYFKNLHTAERMWKTFSDTSFQKAFVTEVLFETDAYIELVAFMPAVWMVCREDRSSSRFHVESIETKRTATAFFLFLVCFYVAEDLHNAYWVYVEHDISVLISIANLAHLALLVDFAFFVLAHIYNPEKLMGELRRWLPVDMHHEV
jgi:hypothetical protein